MSVVFLHDFVGANVPAEDLLIGRADEEQMLFVLVRVVFDAMTHLAVGKAAEK